jgi:alkanesulfonate monooxygenase SsuD/methylene tetrahydromethanopterin reductase-like flavin-dependent oxidoreductase (luciferase family)
VTIRLGLQIPNFSHCTGVAELYPTVVAQAQEAEAAGFDSVFVMDHFYQLPVLGSPDEPMLQAYTALGGLATATDRVQLGTLVTGNSYRNPTLLAKAITTLDVVSQGRAFWVSAPVGSSSNRTPWASSSAPSRTDSTS